ncbi:MAG: acyltransferase [Candidatus Levyibacteriota bacterium]
MKKGFAHFGKNSIIKPILNTTNQHMISIGDNVNIGSFSWVAVSTHFGKGKDASKYKIRLKIGNNVDIGNNAFIVANNDIEIGDHVMTGPYIYISDHSHRYDNVEENLRDQPLTEGGYVKIDKNVFIGIRATIMANVTVGEHAVIGANAVVTKDVPAYTVVVGNPAKAIKKYDFKKKEWIKIK